MRRPLLFVCVCLFVLIALGMQMTDSPPWDSEISVTTGEKVFVAGQVYKKECRVNFGKEIILFYLNLIDYSKEAIASKPEFYQKLYSESSQYITKIICEVNMSDLPKQGGIDTYFPGLGEIILFSGCWQEFPHATNPGEFDLADYYAIEGISGKVKMEELLATNQETWHIREYIFQIRQGLLMNLYKTFPQEDAAILAKMLLGDGSGLNRELRDLYQNNGIVHILSISGLHISMIGMGIYTLLRKGSCPIWVAAVLGGAFILFYGVLTGFGVSSCRAIGMYLIHLLGEIWGKSYDMLTAMGVLAIFLLMENPRLVYHSGYLLSFTSVCGVGLLAPILPQCSSFLMVRPYESRYKKWIKKRTQQAIGGFRISFSVTLFTLPIQLFFFYKIPIYSVFINLLVIPFVSVVMIIGFSVMLLPGLSFLCPIESWILAWFEWLCIMFEKLPGHTWLTGRPPIWKVLVYYGVLLLLILLKKYMKNILTVGVLAGLVLFIGIRVHRGNRIAFLDVGQGDCICVQTATGECYLFDGGSSSKTDVGERIILPYLQFNGISYVDAIFISHPDEDHTNGLGILLNGGEDTFMEEMTSGHTGVTVGHLILPKVAKVEAEFEKVLKPVSKEVQVEYVSKGDVNRQFGISCLHPVQGYEGDTNTYSACYLLELEGVRILLTGDVEGEGEVVLMKELKRRGINQIDILKVAHHGSRYSTTKEFLEVAEIKTAVISCGQNSIYGHPHGDTLERLQAEGCKIHITSEEGAVIFELNEK